MKQNRRKHSPSFKARVALEALKGEETIAERLHQALGYRTPAEVFNSILVEAIMVNPDYNS